MFIASYIFYIKRNEMIYVMQFIETKLNQKKIEIKDLAGEGWQCLKCKTYYEIKDQDNEQLAYLCHKDSIKLYHICSKCGSRWNSVNNKLNCKCKR